MVASGLSSASSARSALRLERAPSNLSASHAASSPAPYRLPRPPRLLRLPAVLHGVSSSGSCPLHRLVLGVRGGESVTGGRRPSSSPRRLGVLDTMTRSRRCLRRYRELGCSTPFCLLDAWGIVAGTLGACFSSPAFLPAVRCASSRRTESRLFPVVQLLLVRAIPAAAGRGFPGESWAAHCAVC